MKDENVLWIGLALLALWWWTSQPVPIPQTNKGIVKGGPLPQNSPPIPPANLPAGVITTAPLGISTSSPTEGVLPLQMISSSPTEGIINDQLNNAGTPGYPN